MNNESLRLMEPMLPTESHNELDDLVVELVQKSARLAGMINPIVQKSVGNLVRSINCYYSNLIEGHDTHPWDINRALAQDYSKEPEKRNLQLEAVAHIEVQKMIDEGSAPDVSPLSLEYILWLHKEFCSRLPDELLLVENPDTGEKIKVTPGQLRERSVRVGKHIPPLPENITSFILRFEQAYDPSILTRIKQIIAVAASHHRLLWIHPFLDGNGRVTRMMSYAALLRENIGSYLWSVSRGLARNETEYKKLLMDADNPRENDLDERGSLSEKALLNFCTFFLNICIDQINYMESILEPTELERRMKLYVEDEMSAGRLPKGSFLLLREALYAGEFERGKAPELTGYKERMARTTVSKLVKKGLLVSDTPKGKLKLGFPLDAVDRWFPRLYPAL